MKELIDFLQREFSDDVKEIQTDLQCICDCLDRVHSEVDKRLPTIKGDYSKIGEYYAMGQELKQIKEKIKAICDLFPESESVGAIDIPKESEIMPEKLPEGTEDISESMDDDLTDEIKEENSIIEKSSKVDYTLYKVDESEPHTLSENFTYKRPCAFSFDGATYPVKDWKQLLLMFCEIIYNRNHSLFRGVVLSEDMQGKSRTYFTKNKETAKSMMVDGRLIGGSIYVETNQNANGICSIIKSILNKYNLPSTLFLIYLKADYTPLHQVEIEHEEKKSNVNISISKKIDSKSSTKSNPDDYRFIKDSYVKQSDPAMNGLSQRMGTPSHLEYLHMKENDTKRHKSRCIEYDNKKDICMCTDSANYLLKCGGSSHCKYYREETLIKNDDTESTIKKKPVIKVIPKNDIKLCPVCKIGTKKESLIVNYLENGKNKRNLLTSYHCEVCKSSYIPDSLYRTYTAHKDKNNIDVEFVMEQAAQQ